MKRLLVLVLSAACASSALAASPPKDPPRATALLAPADEYFGRMKMSPIGIGNEIHDIGLLLKYNPGAFAQYLNRARLTEDALLDWRKHYPADVWLAKDAYLMARVDAMFYDKESHSRAVALMIWVAEKFPQTPYGYNARGQLRRGHIVPLYPMPQTPPTPPPTPAARPEATPT